MARFWRLNPAWGHKAGQRRSQSAKRRYAGSVRIKQKELASADQDRRRCRQGEGRIKNQLSGVHSLTRTRLQGRSASRPRKAARSTLMSDLRSPRSSYFISCWWKVRLRSAGRWALLFPIGQRSIDWSGARFDLWQYLRLPLPVWLARPARQPGHCFAALLKLQAISAKNDLVYATLPRVFPAARPPLRFSVPLMEGIHSWHLDPTLCP
jgi:hypothetical protein